MVAAINHFVTSHMIYVGLLSLPDIAKRSSAGPAMASHMKNHVNMPKLIPINLGVSAHLP